MTNGQNRRYALCFALLTAALLLLAALNLTTGSSRLSVSEVLAALQNAISVYQSRDRRFGGVKDNKEKKA